MAPAPKATSSGLVEWRRSSPAALAAFARAELDAGRHDAAVELASLYSMSQRHAEALARWSGMKPA
jgi:hypothetical protein